MRFLVGIIRYIHYILGITTPSPAQERMVAAIWIVSTLLLIGGLMSFFLLLTSGLLSTR